VTTQVISVQPVVRERLEQLQRAPSVEAGIAAVGGNLHYSKPFELSPELLAAAVQALRLLRSEDAAIVAHLDLSARALPCLIDVKQARRLGGLLHFIAPAELRDQMQQVNTAVTDTKQLTAFIRVLRTRFAECGLHQLGAVLQLAYAAPPKKPTRLELLEAENARLRALLQQHGIDPGEECA